MNSNISSLKLSVVVLDVDRTLIRSVHTTTSSNPYPHYKSSHCEGYKHFVLNCDQQHRTKKCTSSSSNPSISKNSTPSHSHNNKYTSSKSEHYHVYIRPFLKKLMKYLAYIQQTTNVKIAIASMAKRDYVDCILKGLQSHCTENNPNKLSHYPHFDAILTRESWDENISPSTTPTYPISVLLSKYKNGWNKKINLKYKSIQKIGEMLNISHDIDALRNILIIDDDLGYYDYCDRVSGQIYQIPPWNGPRTPATSSSQNKNNITLHSAAKKDVELKSLAAMINAIAEAGSIQNFLFTRVFSVFKHEYGTNTNNAVKLRKDMVNTLINDIGVDIDEETAISSVWIFDNILKCCYNNDDDIGFGAYIETLFGCIIVYHMYFYPVHPTQHFYRLNFTKNEFWKNIMDLFFEYYVRLLLFIKDPRIINASHSSLSLFKKDKYKSKPKPKKNKLKKVSKKLANKLSPSTNTSSSNPLNITPPPSTPPVPSSISSLSTPKTTDNNIVSVSNNIVSDRRPQPQPRSPTNAPIEVAQSEPELLPQKSDIEAQEEIIINSNSNSTPNTCIKKVIKDNNSNNKQSINNNNTINSNNNTLTDELSGDDTSSDVTPTSSIFNKKKKQMIILTAHHYKSIQDNLKTLVKEISKSLFWKNRSPACFIGYNLLSASRSNPKYMSKYSRVLKKIFRDRNKFDL